MAVLSRWQANAVYFIFNIELIRAISQTNLDVCFFIVVFVPRMLSSVIDGSLD